MEIARTGLLGGFQFKVEHSADEVGELGVAFGSTGNGIKRRLRVGLGAADTLYIDYGVLSVSSAY